MITRTHMRMTMRIDPILTLTQWLSPSYPVGAFTYSHGLESSVHSGMVHDAPSFSEWLKDVLSHGAGRNDVILLAAAYNTNSEESLHGLDELARALAPSAERLLETDQQGAAFAQTTGAVFDTDLSRLTYPVAIGRAAALQQLPLRDTARLFLHAFAASLTSAAIRLIPLGQTAGQTALHSVTPLCQSIADQAITQSLDDLGASSFATDIASMAHETQYSRLFRS
ncbi:urease accessory protein [Shimia abyssi]|uniref:Urease accessory protein UreF n=2 Tax=Shimia abyssi TaxID=1662395 RepID=A0A2P8FHK4_9RHOB|nr:urease accessory protein [Shimia abyssi]